MERIPSQDNNVKRICNSSYQDFIEFILELLQVNTQAHQLVTELQTLAKSSEQIRASDLVKAWLKPDLECYIKFCKQIINMYVLRQLWKIIIF